MRVTEASDPAFPTQDKRGLNKREYFAGAAMRGLLPHSADLSFEEIARMAVTAADALIEALNRARELAEIEAKSAGGQ